MADTKLKIDQRRSRILDQIKRDGKVSVAQLARSLGVTNVTIRCDLDALEKEGHLERINGGAVLGNGLRPLAGQLDPREVELRERKLAVAKAVAAMVSSGDTVFINSGGTAMLTAEYLCKMHAGLNIVTNSVAVAAALAGTHSFRVVLLGGELNTQYGFTHGSDAEDKLRVYHADFAILSVDGISAHGGVTTYHPEEAIIDRIMISGANRVIIAADSSKIGKAGFMRVYDPTREITLVTNSDADETELDRLAERGVSVVTVKTY
jgi:DeoR/GlpR family transcriptional regulator of sugar metabolism